MTSDLSVSANFTIQNRTLTVNYNGTGGGFVSGPGIACPEDCTEIYNYGNEVTLTAYPSGGSDFAGWSGACSGTGTCVINMLTDSSVTAFIQHENSRLDCPYSRNWQRNRGRTRYHLPG